MRSLSKVHRRAKKMRSHLSLPEGLLWSRLRYLCRQDGPVFRRQHPAGPYILDFYCSAARLCIEVDGQAHGFGDRPFRDERRDAYLRSLGIRVLRVPASTVLEDPEAVAMWLIDEARAPPQSSDRGVR
jgi:very-short-patch-repair endonuclease